MPLLCVNYHYIRPAFPAQGIHGETPAQFRDQLERLAKIGTFVSAAQVRAGTIPERAILITFDDGLREQYEYAWPILQAMGIPAIFFVNTEPIVNQTVLDVHNLHLLIASGAVTYANVMPPEAQAKYPYDLPHIASMKYRVNVQMTPEQRSFYLQHAWTRDEAATARTLYITPEIAQVYRLYGALGIHGHGHNRPERGWQKARLYCSIWGVNPFACSYPFGDRGACVPEEVAHQGFELGFTMERGVNADRSRPLMLGRISCADLPDEGPLDSLWDLPRCVWA